MDTYNRIVTVIGCLLGMAATVLLLWSAYTDDGREETTDEYGQELDR